MIYYCYYPILCTFDRYKSVMYTHTQEKQKPRIIQEECKAQASYWNALFCFSILDVN